MKENYLVSIVIPIFNVEKYVSECLDSVLAQTYKKLEIIAIDDGSTDDSGKICDKYASMDNRIRVIHNTNGGVAAARNCGLDESHGEYIAFVDSDDIVAENYIEELLGACLLYDCKISQCKHIRFINNEYKELKKSLEKGTCILLDGREVTKKIYSNEGVDTTALCTKLYHKSVFEGQRFPLGKIHEDFFLSFELLYTTPKIACMDYTLYYYRKSENSITTVKFNKKRLHYLEAVETQMNYYERSGDNELFNMSLEHYMYSIMNFIDLAHRDMEQDLKEVIDVLKEKMKRALMICKQKNISVPNKYIIVQYAPVATVMITRKLSYYSWKIKRGIKK
ncbi:glycosyltransferase family 2 protein [Butyrivibrio sp. AC2005]|uniref:glycosyltransferase family 2 protein n=1 Tax=Butyrivibrio sp. AC2005 TaxID=1280672 RepID=UPI00041A4952|nr:glycosyltransferase family 2 protein [Butyrivibrio sp. AC2005]